MGGLRPPIKKSLHQHHYQKFIKQPLLECIVLQQWLFNWLRLMSLIGHVFSTYEAA